MPVDDAPLRICLSPKNSSFTTGIVLACIVFTFAGCAPSRQAPSYPVLQSHDSSQPVKPRPQPQKRTGPVVFLDAGHGGHDIGAAVKPSHLQEKNLNLEVVKRVERLLLGWKYTVVLSRRTDVFVPLKKRVAMAARNNATIFVSVHFNSVASKKNRGARGAEAYYYNTPDSQRTADSKRLGAAILRCLCEDLPTQYRGVKLGNLCVIRETTMPAVLVEPAFITNSKDARLLSSAPYKQQIALAIARGINDYFHPT